MADDARAVVSGSGRIVLTATKSLDATVSGSGAIMYGGNPEEVEQSVTGSGAIAIDAATEARIIAGLRAELADVTVISVAHRQSTLDLAEQVARANAIAERPRGLFGRLLGPGREDS